MKKIICRTLILMLAALLAGGGAGCTSKAKKVYHQHRADKFFAAGQFDNAEIEYMNVLRNDPNDEQAYARLGDIYYQQGRLQSAAPYLLKASSMDTNDLDLHLKLAYVYASFGGYKDARDEVEFILGRTPKNDEAPLLLASISTTPKDAAAARAQLQNLAASNGDRAAYEVALGTLALQAKDIASAEDCFKRAVALDPKSPSALEAMGIYYASLNDTNDADVNLKAASDLSDARSARRMMYAKFKMQTGKLDEATQILTDDLKQAPDYVPALLGLAEISFAETNFDDASSHVKQVLARDPDNFDGLMFQSRLYIAQNQMNQAVSVLERMSKVYPKAPTVQYELAAGYVSSGNDDKAIECLNQALQLNPNFTEAQLLLAQTQIRDRNPEPAIVAMSDLVQKQPQLEDAQLLLADAYRESSRIPDALAVYQSLEKSFPRDVRLPLLSGSAYLQSKDNASARAAFMRAQQLEPDNLEALTQLVSLDVADKDYPTALQRIQVPLQTRPNDVNLHLLVAQVLMGAKKMPEAEAELTKAAALDPKNPDPALLLAQLYSNAHQYDKALAQLANVTTQYPQSIPAWMLSAAIYDQQKDYKAEANAYEKALAINPKLSSVLNNLAYIYSEYLGQPDRAYDLAQQARTLLPFDGSTADTLGWICLKRQSYTQAVGLLQDASKKLPGSPDVQYHYGMACYMTDDETDARAALQQALQLGTDFRGHDECQLCLSVMAIDSRTADANAQALLEKRVADSPNDPVALGRLAAIYMREGNLDKAAQDYQAVLQTDPKNLNATLALAHLYVSKDLAKAMDMAKAANQIAPDNIDSMHLIGQIAYQTGDYKLAITWLQQSANAQPNDPQEQFDYARAAYNTGDVPTAQAKLQSALSLNLPAPQSTEAQQMLDMINLYDNPAQAVASSQKVADILGKNPKDVPALMAQAIIQWQQSGPAAAAPDGEKVLSLLPDFAPAERLLALIYSHDPNNLKRGYDLAAKARNAYPDDLALTKATGIIVFQQGDFNRAVRLLTTCTEGANPDAETYYYLGAAQFQLHQKFGSKNNLQKALSMNLSGPLADSANKMLAQLK